MNNDIKISFIETPIVLRMHQGVSGKDGQDGDAATVRVGTVTTVAPTAPAAVRNTGTSHAAVLDFDIPKGDPGDASSVPWGNVTGDLEDQADLVAALALKADAAGITLRPDYDIVPDSQEPEDGVSALETGKLVFVYEE